MTRKSPPAKCNLVWRHDDAYRRRCREVLYASLVFLARVRTHGFSRCSREGAYPPEAE